MAVESVRIEGLDAAVRTLRELPAELVSKRGGPVRTALQKAAKRIQQEEQAQLQRIIDAPNVGEDVAESTGLLKQNIIVKRGRLAGGEKGELYSVRVRRKSYPGTKGKAVTTPQVARLLEYGTAKREPMPFIRPAFEAAKGYVFQTFTAELNRRLAGIVKKLHRTNGGKP
jgi:HK97 gp10 family phage protein